MIYESKATAFGVTLQRAMLKFQCNESGYGEFDTTDAATIKRLGLSEKEAISLIEDTQQFKKGIPGEFGVWKKADRLSKASLAAKSEGLRAAMEELEESALRDLLIQRNIEIPMTATKKDLVDLVCGTSEEPKETKPKKPSIKRENF